LNPGVWDWITSVFLLPFAKERFCVAIRGDAGAIKMLSIDELANGKTFILKLKDVSGIPIQWVETLRGAIARRWYEIYRNSDWDALRLEAASIFLHRVTELEADRSRRSSACVVIHTDAVKENELARPPGAIQA
jgi:hypothetical protein